MWWGKKVFHFIISIHPPIYIFTYFIKIVNGSFTAQTNDKDFKPKPKLAFLEFAANSGLPGCTIEVFKLIVKSGNFVPASGRIPTTEKPLWAHITKSIIGFDASKERLDELWALMKSTEQKSSNLETVMELAANLKNLEGAIDESELEQIKDVAEKHREQIRVACLRMERPSMVGVRTA